VSKVQDNGALVMQHVDAAIYVPPMVETQGVVAGAVMPIVIQRAGYDLRQEQISAAGEPFVPRVLRANAGQSLFMIDGAESIAVPAAFLKRCRAAAAGDDFEALLLAAMGGPAAAPPAIPLEDAVTLKPGMYQVRAHPGAAPGLDMYEEPVGDPLNSDEVKEAADGRLVVAAGAEHVIGAAIAQHTRFLDTLDEMRKAYGTAKDAELLKWLGKN
jgi:hypothetical protein